MPSLNPYAAADPGYQAQQLDLARRQALAQALSQQGMSPIDYDPHGLISPWQGVAKLAAVLMGGSMGKQNIKDAANLSASGNQMLQENGFGLGAGSDATQISNSPARSAGNSGMAPPASQPPDASPSGPSPQALAAALSPQAASQQALIQGAQQGSAGQTVANATRMDALAAQPQQSPQAQPTASPNTASQPAQAAGGGRAAPPLSMPGMTPQQSYMAYVMDPQGYMQALISRTDNRTDLVKTMLSAGIDPRSPEGNQFAVNYLKKQGYIEPQEVHAGGGFRDPTTGAITMVPPEAPGGFRSVQNPDGSWTVVPVQGGTAAISDSAAATEQGKAPFSLIDTFNSTTGAPSKNYAGNVLPLPPVGGNPGQPSAGAPGAPTFDIGGSPQQRAWIFKSIANDPTVDAAIRRAAAAQLQQIQGGGAQANSDARSNGVQTGPAIGQSQGAVNAQDELSKSWSQQQQAHAQAQTNVYTLQSLKSLADRSITGGGGAFDKREFMARLGAYAGVPGAAEAATSTDLMNKYSAQLIAGLSARGMNTDAARDLVMAGSPNSKMQPAAIKEAVDGLIAREQMTQARTGVLQPYAASRDAPAFQGAASKFDAIADPRLWQMRSMTPQQLQAFTSRMPAGDARQLMQKYQAATQMGAFQ